MVCGSKKSPVDFHIYSHFKEKRSLPFSLMNQKNKWSHLVLATGEHRKLSISVQRWKEWGPARKRENLQQNICNLLLFFKFRQDLLRLSIKNLFWPACSYMRQKLRVTKQIFSKISRLLKKNGQRKRIGKKKTIMIMLIFSVVVEIQFISVLHKFSTINMI